MDPVRRLPLSFRKRIAKRLHVSVRQIPRTLAGFEARVGVFVRMHERIDLTAGSELDSEILIADAQADLCAARRVCS